MRLSLPAVDWTVCGFAQGLQMILRRLGWKMNSSHRLITKVARVSHSRPSFWQFWIVLGHWTWPKHQTETFVFDLKDVLYSYTIRDIIFVQIRPSSFRSQRLEIFAISRTWFFSPPQSDFNLAWTMRKVATRTGQKQPMSSQELCIASGGGKLCFSHFSNLRAGTTGSGAHVQLCATSEPSAYPIHPANGPGAPRDLEASGYRWKQCSFGDGEGEVWRFRGPWGWYVAIQILALGQKRGSTTYTLWLYIFVMWRHAAKI